MIEFAVARSGAPLFKLEGRLLCSSVDPQREAQTWVEQHQPLLQAPGRIVVLGLGCGHHIKALCDRYPNRRILVVSSNQEIIEACRKIHPLLLDGIDVLSLSDVGDALNQPIIKQYLRGPYFVLSHAASQVGDESFYGDLRALLIGRDPVFSARLIRQDQHLSRIFPLQSVGGGGEESTLLSIKNLDRMIDLRVEGEAKHILIFKTLREMVR